MGGIAFAVQSAGPALEEGDQPAYRDFLAPGPEPGDEVTEVQVSPGDPALPPSARRLFDAGTTWSAYRLPGGERAVAVAPPALGPLLHARFDREVRRITLRYALHLAEHGPLLNPLRYPLDQVLLMYRLAALGGAIVHCAIVAVGDRAVLCPGVSGAGKTTLARQLAGQPGLAVLSDDRAVVRRERGGGWRAYGTPWPGEGGFAVNRGLPLAALGFLERGDAPATARLSPAEAVKRLALVTSVPWYDREIGPQVFDHAALLCTEVPAWPLAFALDGSAPDAVCALARG